ncbi:hypothetical protein [Variovorax sp. YR216]|uniref:hypothetical protein n=1 Tax=Variovorax sp. YR216 TaxID=1882828 RepID=UPI0015A3FA1A|nr:hypothetical protein [Variovorax sp. YR216]
MSSVTAARQVDDVDVAGAHRDLLPQQLRTLVDHSVGGFLDDELLEFGVALRNSAALTLSVLQREVPLEQFTLAADTPTPIGKLAESLDRFVGGRVFRSTTSCLCRDETPPASKAPRWPGSAV